MSITSPEFDAWVERARGCSVEEVAFERYKSVKLRKSSEGWEGECPKCGGQDRFSINIKKNVWNCRHCDKGGDAIALIMNVEDLQFVDAVTEITGEPPPRHERREPTDMKDNPAARERMEERRDREVTRETQEEKKRRETIERVNDIWTGLQPFKGSHAQRYLVARAVVLTDAQFADLRFAPAMDYLGFEDTDDEVEKRLGQFPAMVAAIRNAAGDIIGIHRTYLDPSKPAKLTPPGDHARNLAKKVFGVQRGGHIRLGPICECMAMGEGIETVGGWYSLGVGPEDIGMLVAINLGNLSGGCMGSLVHPRMPTKKIPDGIPDPDKPGIILPDGIKSLILLGDGDSEPYFTRARMLAAGRRFRAHGVEISYCWPEDGEDFNVMARRLAA